MVQTPTVTIKSETELRKCAFFFVGISRLAQHIGYCPQIIGASPLFSGIVRAPEGTIYFIQDFWQAIRDFLFLQHCAKHQFQTWNNHVETKMPCYASTAPHSIEIHHCYRNTVSSFLPLSPIVLASPLSLNKNTAA